MQSTPKIVDKTVTNSPNTDETGGAHFITPDKMAEAQEAQKEFQKTLESRVSLPAAGDPSAVVSDPFMTRVAARYNIVQNRSNLMLIIPDLKTNPEDMGLVLNPGDSIRLTDFYSPQEINRSKGLRYSATKLQGVNGFALVPLNDESEGADFKVPERRHYEKGTSYDDTTPNDFDLRFEELETKEAKREEKLMRKTLAGRVTRQHGQAPERV